MNHKYLFFLAEGNIETFKCKEGVIERVLFQGNSAFSGEIDTFWDWWERNRSFNIETDKVDFCLISDRPGNHFAKNYSTVDINTWQLDEIKECVSNTLNHHKITLIDSTYENLSLEVIKGNCYTPNHKAELYLELVPNKSLQDGDSSYCREEDVDAIDLKIIYIQENNARREENLRKAGRC